MLNYIDAINKIDKDFGKESFQDPFLILSLLSDYVGQSYSDKLLVQTYFNINKIFNVYYILKNNDANTCKTIFGEKYSDFKDSITKQLYYDAIRPVAKLFYPDDFTGSQSNNTLHDETNTSVIIVRNTNQKAHNQSPKQTNGKANKPNNAKKNNNNKNIVQNIPKPIHPNPAGLKKLSIICGESVIIYVTKDPSYYIASGKQIYFDSLSISSNGDSVIKSDTYLTIYLTDNLIERLSIDAPSIRICADNKSRLHFKSLNIINCSIIGAINCDSDLTTITCKTYAFSIKGCHRSISFENTYVHSNNTFDLDISKVSNQLIYMTQNCGESTIHFKNYPQRSLHYRTLAFNKISETITVGNTKVSIECQGISSKVTIN